jgi:hypothetical protein
MGEGSGPLKVGEGLGTGAVNSRYWTAAPLAMGHRRSDGNGCQVSADLSTPSSHAPVVGGQRNHLVAFEPLRHVPAGKH